MDSGCILGGFWDAFWGAFSGAFWVDSGVHSGMDSECILGCILGWILGGFRAGGHFGAFFGAPNRSIPRGLRWIQGARSQSRRQRHGSVTAVWSPTTPPPWEEFWGALFFTSIRTL